MESGTTLTGIIILLVIFIPFIFMGINSRKKKNIMKEKLQNIAKKNNCKIKNFDIWKTSGIAFDESENFLVGYRKTTEYEIDIFYNLQDFSNCKIVKTSRTELDNLVIENLKLVLTCKKNANKQETFEFYNVNTDSSQLGDEIELINKWHELILSKLK